VLSAFAQDTPDEARQLYQQAQDLARAHKFDQAAAAMAKAIRLAPRNDLYLATASDYERQAGDYTAGVDHALQAIRLNDKVGAYYLLVAVNAYGAQDLDRAREYVDQVLKRGQEFGAAAVKDARTIQARLVPVTYTLHWTLDPDKGRPVNGALPIAVPRNGLPYQSVTYEVKGVRSQRLAKGEANDVLQVVPRGTDSFPLTTKVTVRPYSFKTALAKARPGTLPREARAFLGASEAINPRSPAVKKVAAGLKAANPVDTVRHVLAWMKKHIEYRLDQKPLDQPDFQSVDEILDRGHAECRGYAALFTALCRAAGVPTRPIWGLARVLPDQDKRFGDIASHNWAEVYVTGCGWVPVDPQHPESLGFLPTNCIRIFMDARRSKTSTEIRPMLNLFYMYGGALKFDEAR
jgi:transglutaminase-like putative cysteine protease